MDDADTIKFLAAGHTRVDLALKLGLTPSQLEGRISIDPKFALSVLRGERERDLPVERAMYKAAIGYTYKESTIKMRETPDGIFQDDTTQTKSAAPNPSAAQFILTNRQAGLWKNKAEVTEVPYDPVTALTDAELDEVARKAGYAPKKRTLAAKRVIEEDDLL